MRWSLSVYLSSTSYCLMICWYLLSLGVVWMCYLASFALLFVFFFFSSRRRHTRLQGDWSSDVCSSDLLQPLLAAHGRVAVLIVDAMRADLWNRLHDDVASALAGRTLRQKWAVVPEPTRTTEAVAALYLGRPVPPGAGPASPADLGLPFAHLGYESAALVGVDRPYAAEALRELWAAGPKISVAVATSVDEMLHRSSVELAGLLDEAPDCCGGGCPPRRRCPPRALLAWSPPTASRRGRPGGRGSLPPGPPGGRPRWEAWGP